MSKLRHKINGKYIDNPANWQELTFKLDYTEKGNNSFDINLSSFLYKGKQAIELIERIKNGTSGGVGIYEADVYELEYQEQTIWEGYIDYSKSKIEACNIVSIPVHKRFGAEWLNKKLDAYSYRYMYASGLIRNSDFVNVPYVINYIPDGQQIVVLSLALFVMVDKLIETVEATGKQIATIANALTPNAGVGITWDLGDYVDASIALGVNIAKSTALVIAIKNLVEKIFQQILGEKRSHKGMTVKKLFEKGCEQIGLELKSSLLDNIDNWVIIPPKNHKGGEKPTDAPGSWRETGIPESKSALDTFGGVLRVFIEWFNADYRIRNGVFEFERRDYWNKNKSSYVIPSVFANQNDLTNPAQYNTDEIASNYALSYSTDIQDQNTLDNTQGTYYQAITEEKVSNNKDLVLIDGLQDIFNPCSLGTRKKRLTEVETLLRELGSFVDRLTSILGSGTNFASKIEKRVGSLNLSSHFTNTPKLVVMQGKTLAKNQREKLDANKIYYDYHYINSMATVTGNDGLTVNNQHRLPDPSRVKFSYENIVSLSDSKLCKTDYGDDAEIETIEWNEYEATAEIKYRVAETYTDNLKLTVV